jgi:hypothetical protein
MITYILMLIAATSFAYEEVQERIRTKWGDIREHWASIVTRGSHILLGAFFVAGEIDLIQIPLLLGIYWLLTDGIMNVMRKFKYFRVAEQSGDPFRYLLWAKILLIIVGIILVIYV